MTLGTLDSEHDWFLPISHIGSLHLAVRARHHTLPFSADGVSYG